jgi:hypothetical protein
VTAAFVTVVSLALLPQLLFFVLYWKWIPSWIHNKYGRLAQAGAMCHIILLSLYLFLVAFGKHFNPRLEGIVLVLAFVPLIFFGLFQLSLLKLAVDSANAMTPIKEVVIVDTGNPVREDKERVHDN